LALFFAVPIRAREEYEDNCKKNKGEENNCCGREGIAKKKELCPI
jgi:hypothetical protein